MPSARPPAAPQEPPDFFDAGAAQGLRPPSGRGGIALEKAMLYITWLIPVLESFPRSQRFLLGDRLQGLALDTVEALVEATYTKAPVETLRRVNIRLEQQRLMVRLAYNLRYLNGDRYEFACRKLDDIGRGVGAWLKRMKAAATALPRPA